VIGFAKPLGSFEIAIGTPMHNFTVPSVLKAWIDQILRRSHLHVDAYSEGGMLLDRPVFIGIASGGVFTGDEPTSPIFSRRIYRWLWAALG
jgi:FMN-dependent NADH-azoreductase